MDTQKIQNLENNSLTSNQSVIKNYGTSGTNQNYPR